MVTRYFIIVLEKPFKIFISVSETQAIPFDDINNKKARNLKKIHKYHTSVKPSRYNLEVSLFGSITLK